MYDEVDMKILENEKLIKKIRLSLLQDINPDEKNNKLYLNYLKSITNYINYFQDIIYLKNLLRIIFNYKFIKVNNYYNDINFNTSITINCCFLIIIKNFNFQFIIISIILHIIIFKNLFLLIFIELSFVIIISYNLRAFEIIFSIIIISFIFSL